MYYSLSEHGVLGVFVDLGLVLDVLCTIRVPEVAYSRTNVHVYIYRPRNASRATDD